MKILFSKVMPILVTAIFSTVILTNIISNWNDNNYRSKSDYYEAVKYVNAKAIPATTLYTTAMEFAGFDAYKGLSKIRRDFVYQRHNYELDASFFKPGTARIDVPAIFYHQNIESKDPLYYMKDFESIRREFFVAPLEKTPAAKFRHIVADSGNAKTYQASAIRNVYYLLPKPLESHLRVSQLDLKNEQLDKNRFYFISNGEYDSTKKSIQMIEMTYPLSVFVPVLKEASGKVDLNFIFENKPNRNSCKFKSAQLQFFYNNHFIKQSEISFGVIHEELLLPKEFNYEQINVLSLVLSFNQANQYSQELISPNMCQLAVREYSYSTVPEVM